MSRPRSPPWTDAGKVLAAVVAATALLGAATMPRFWYPGDNLVARSEAIRLVQEARLGVEYSDASLERAGARGQYYVWNDARRVLYSKYGFGYTLLYVPAVAVERVLRGEDLDPFDQRESLLLAIHLYNLLLAAGTIAYLYRIASSFEPSPVVAAGFVVAAVYPSYVWHYLRAPALEPWQIFFFVAFCAHALRFLRVAGEAGGWSRAAKAHLAAATALAGVLLLLRPTFGVLLPLLGTAALASGDPRVPLLRRAATNARERAAPLALAFVLPAAALISVWLAANHLRTGSALDPGYAQWVGADGLPMNRFSWAAIPAALHGFLLQPGNANVFLHHPLLLVALPLWPAFLRRHRQEGLFLAAVGAVGVGVIAATTNWRGEWCYGPRYLVHSAVALSIPAVGAWRALRSARRAWRWAAGSAAGAALGAGLWMQIEVNSLHYFAFQTAAAAVAPGDRLQPWLEAPGPRALRLRQLEAFVRDGEPFGPVEAVTAALPEAQRERARASLRRSFEGLLEPNWYLPHALGAARP